MSVIGFGDRKTSTTTHCCDKFTHSQLLKYKMVDVKFFGSVG